MRSTSVSQLLLEFYRQLCDSFGLTDVVGKTRRVRETKDQIQYMYTEKKQTMILILMKPTVSQYRHSQ